MTTPNRFQTSFDGRGRSVVVDGQDVTGSGAAVNLHASASLRQLIDAYGAAKVLESTGQRRVPLFMGPRCRGRDPVAITGEVPAVAPILFTAVLLLPFVMVYAGHSAAVALPGV